MRKLFVSLILLGVLLAVLDRVAVAGVQREVARQVAARYDLATPPAVEVHGIPFLTQAIAGRYEEVTVSIGRISVPGGAHVERVDAVLRGVRAPLMDLIQNSATADVRADEVTGTVVISRQTLEARAPRGLRVRGNGDDTLQVTGDVTVAGVTIPVTAKMKIEVIKGGIRLTPENVNGIQVPNATRLLSFTVPVKELPLNLKIERVRSIPEGLAVEGRATDVPLRD
ncbi:hypothetical protein Sme01_57510 [Sphaerisporangium melleum]|uniref:DUF2993 domain-containing protein n=1 Tax=Sphaerisporangium melleum TaxID=321316 RepID=A0A917R808_9ACTN|nr:DUF2993 domain-containing protein [Sphaerisporangium melleum]GGK94795.1 hypothetical protein GCM10007964_41390 [Sphaerisporangium melleum]GII73275.1 hypothetical protein Sme01_57510 [Sphaerisporangium melleum]